MQKFILGTRQFPCLELLKSSATDGKVDTAFGEDSAFVSLEARSKQFGCRFRRGSRQAAMTGYGLRAPPAREIALRSLIPASCCAPAARAAIERRALRSSSGGRWCSPDLLCGGRLLRLAAASRRGSPLRLRRQTGGRVRVLRVRPSMRPSSNARRCAAYDIRSDRACGLRRRETRGAAWCYPSGRPGPRDGSDLALYSAACVAVGARVWLRVASGVVLEDAMW